MAQQGQSQHKRTNSNVDSQRKLDDKFEDAAANEGNRQRRMKSQDSKGSSDGHRVDYDWLKSKNIAKTGVCFKIFLHQRLLSEQLKE